MSAQASGQAANRDWPDEVVQDLAADLLEHQGPVAFSAELVRTMLARLEDAGHLRDRDARNWDEGKAAGLKQADWEYGATPRECIARNPHRE